MLGPKRSCIRKWNRYDYVKTSKQLHERIDQLTRLDGQVPDIVFEAIGVYSKALEKLLRPRARILPY